MSLGYFSENVKNPKDIITYLCKEVNFLLSLVS